MYHDTGAAWELVASPSPFKPLIVNNYYPTSVLCGNMGGAGSYGANIMFTTIYPCHKTATYDRIAAECQALDAAGKWRLGIYEDNGSGYPGGLIRDAGEVDPTAVGMQSLPLSPSVQLIGGHIYWLALLTNSIIAQVYYGQHYGVYTYLGGYNAHLQDTWFTYYVAQVFGPLPNPFPLAASIHNYCWALGLRLASVP